MPFLKTFLIQFIAIAIFVSCMFQVASPGKESKSSSEASTPVTSRDWKLHPAIVELPAPDVFYALGDVHGDCDRMLQVLAAAQLINSASASSDAIKWTGGKTDLVLTGDVIDKYSQNIRVISTLRILQTQAEEAGGHLILSLGNHEAEFLAAGGDDKKGAEFEKELKARGISQEEVAAGRDSAGIGTWMRNLPAGTKVGDWFFCHAGNTGGKKLADLETELEKALTDQGFSTPLLIDPNSMLEARMHPRPWFEGTSDPSLHDVKEPKALKEKGNKAEKAEAKAEKKKEKEETNATIPPLLAATLEGLHVKHLVIGHQPGKATFSNGRVRAEGQMFETYNGAFFMIDTGMSRGVSSGRGAVLRIDVLHQSVSAIYADGTTTVLWH